MVLRGFEDDRDAARLHQPSRINHTLIHSQHRRCTVVRERNFQVIKTRAILPGKEGSMTEHGFAPCDHIFSFECSGEVANLVHAADRYGILMEKARARIDAICRQCRKVSRMGSRRVEDEEG
jgi:hypothetical protein